MTKLIVQFSGGKDSMASLLWVKNNLSKEFLTVFCDTKWESEITYKYIQDTNERMNLNIITLTSKKYDGFLDMVKNKGRFPSPKARFCTEQLKTIPMIDYILDEVHEDILVIQGIRGDESFARSKMSKQCTYFKFYFQPYTSNEIVIEELGKKPFLTLVQTKKLAKAKERLSKGFKDEKFHTYRKKEVFAFCKKYADDILRPVFDWTGQEVIDYSLANGFKPNPLYGFGMKRVGCFPCIMSNQVDVRSINTFFPERIKEIAEFEKETGSTLFPPDKIPKRFMTNKKYPTITDVTKYIENKNATGDLFEEEYGTSCMSFYGLCE